MASTDRLMQTYEEVGTVFAIVNKLATATSKVDWKLYRTAASGLKEDRVEVTKHACIDLWEKPNPFMHRRRFVEMCQQHIDLTGESDPLLTYAGSFPAPLEMWPMRPDRIEPVQSQYEFITGYVYTAPDGERVPLDTRECLPIMQPNPRDPFRGIGPVQSILTDIDSVKYSAEWNRAFFENSAEPGGVIQVPTALNDNEFERLRAQWSEDHKGVAKAHRVAILESDAKWVSNAFTQKDMQFAELRGIGRDVILEAFGFPRFMLGIVEDVNRASAEASEYFYAKWLIEDRCDRWRDWLNFSLLPQYGGTGEGLEWDYVSPVPANGEAENASITARSEALVKVTGAGFDEKDVLAWLGLPALGFTKPEPKVVQLPPGAKPGQDEEK
jgi:HK97 family phage portal protein